MNKFEKTLLVVVSTIVLTFIFMFLMWLGGALAVGAANAWIIQGTFMDGWDAAYGRPFHTMGFAMLFLSGGSLGLRR